MRFEPLKMKAALMIDGYTKVKGFEGPFRSEGGDIVYFDNLKNKYISAKSLHRITNQK